MSGILTVIHTVNVARQVCRYQVEKFIPHKPSEIRSRTCAGNPSGILRWTD